MKSKKFSVVIGAIAVILMIWVVMGFEGNELPYVTIVELKDVTSQRPAKRFRLGGNVEEGSILRSESDLLDLTFVLEQDTETLPVRYHKIVPDMFSEGAEVIVEGYYVNGEFHADNLMTKCASRYEGDLRETQETS